MVFIGIQNQPPSPTPEAIEIEAIESTPIPSEIPSPTITEVIYPSPTIKISPTPVPTVIPSIDLNFETLLIVNNSRPEYYFKTKDNYKIKTDEKIDSIYLGIRNNGHEDALNVQINIIADGESVYQGSIDKIEKQSLKNQQLKDVKLPNSIGRHIIEVQINPSWDFDETRKDNNSKTIEYEYLN